MCCGFGASFLLPGLRPRFFVSGAGAGATTVFFTPGGRPLFLVSTTTGGLPRFFSTFGFSITFTAGFRPRFFGSAAGAGAGAAFFPAGLRAIGF